jgi:chemotaxis protein CheD
VGIGQIRVAAPPERLAVYGLGSCVVVFLHDSSASRAGLAHILLPGPPPARALARTRLKYAGPAVRALVQELSERGAARRRLVAKLVGGASMFTTEGSTQTEPIGERNVSAVLASLEELGLPVAARETGGNIGRSLVADPATGLLRVWSLRSESRTL